MAVQSGKHCENRDTCVVGLTNWYSILGTHSLDTTQLKFRTIEMRSSRDSRVMFSLPDDDQLWLLVLNLHQKIASGLLGGVPSILHLDHQLIGDIGCQGVSEKGDGRSW